jgi:hypothetical protein
MGQPSHDVETLAAHFHGVGPQVLDHPVAGPVLERLAAEDPDVIAAVADVDRSQIRCCLAGNRAAAEAAGRRSALVPVRRVDTARLGCSGIRTGQGAAAAHRGSAPAVPLCRLARPASTTRSKARITLESTEALAACRPRSQYGLDRPRSVSER